MAMDDRDRGQVKDDEGTAGKLLSHEQDVGELSAQNRGGTARNPPESKRLEEQDREEAREAAEARRAEAEKLLRREGLDEEGCDTSAEENRAEEAGER